MISSCHKIIIAAKQEKDLYLKDMVKNYILISFQKKRSLFFTVRMNRISLTVERIHRTKSLALRVVL